jgi:surface polysaccharide O-acyltransferase-like enzyme
MVVLIHVSSIDFGHFGAHWLAANLFDSLSRPAVPLFFMLTGALLVPREIDLSVTLHRTGKIVLVLIVWSYAYIAVGLVFRPSEPLAQINPMRILAGPVVTHFWYFYSLLGLYLFLPVLSAFYRLAPRAPLYLFVALCFVPTSLDIIERLVGLRVGIDLTYFAPFAGYALLGAVLSNTNPTTKTAGVLILAALVLGTLTAIATAGLSAAEGSPAELFYQYSAPLVFAAAACLFVGLRSFVTDGSTTVAKFIRLAAPNALGIYILHMLPIRILDRLDLLPAGRLAWAVLPGAALLVWCACLAATMIVRRYAFGRAVLP